MKLCISTCFPKERCSLVCHYQSCTCSVQGAIALTPHSPTSPLWNSCPSTPWWTRDHCWGSWGSTWGEQNYPFPQLSKPHTEKAQHVLNNQATASSHHFCHWPGGLFQCPKMAGNPSSKPKLSSVSFGHWISSSRGPIRWQLVREEQRKCSIPLVALSDQHVSNLNCFLRPPSPTVW